MTPLENSEASRAISEAKFSGGDGVEGGRRGAISHFDPQKNV